MEGGQKKGSIFKKLESCLFKHKGKGGQVVPAGCFSVYVGPERQRFVIKTECANHPLFKFLLEDAESEYGFRSDGPLLLPCDVDIFCRVLAAMDDSVEDDDDDRFGVQVHRHGGSCSPFSSAARRLGRTASSYGRLAQPRLLKIDQF